MHNKFMGSGSTVWETGIFQPKGVNSAGQPAWRTMSSDALKLWVKKSNIAPTTKKTKEMLLELDFINKSMKPNEIKEAAIEMDDRLKKKWTIKESETHLQKKYWKILFNFTRFKKYFWLNDDFKISTNFLKQNESWLFKDGKN